tara:strand:+ start:3786 stop:4433 length:648 start_codon:yes stop_codon:yes gene_type:complete
MNIMVNTDSANPLRLKEYCCAILRDKTEHHVSVETTDDNNRFVITVSSKRLDVVLLHHDGAQVTLLINGSKCMLPIRVEGNAIEVLYRGVLKEIRICDRHNHLSGVADLSDIDDTLTAPMPAIVSNILVAVGQEVRKGEEIVHLESMKMIIPLTAPYDGVVEDIHVEEGQTAQLDQLLVSFQRKDSQVQVRKEPHRNNALKPPLNSDDRRSSNGN